MFNQLSSAEKGETVAIMKTNMGEIKIRLFPQFAPKSVENFITLAKNGYYNGIIFHRVINDFMIQGGDPTGTGTGGESIWGERFEDEFTPELHNFRGALCMANAGPDTNGSQFFIVQAKSVPDEMLDQLRMADEKYYPTECIENYETVGGTPWLDYHHSVFGQVYDGMDTVDAIAGVKVDFLRNKPVEDVVIENITVETL